MRALEGMLALRSVPALRRARQHGPVAQWLEQGTHNPLVGGSNPSRPTRAVLMNPMSVESLFSGTDVQPVWKHRRFSASNEDL